MKETGNKKDSTNRYKIQNCMWAAFNGDNFHCEMKQIATQDAQLAIVECSRCAQFRDTNVEIEGGYLR